MLRISAGADILGSKNSMCDGPPERNSTTTALSRTYDLPPGSELAWACAASSCGSPRPAKPRLPILRNSLRRSPEQLWSGRGSQIESMAALLTGCEQRLAWSDRQRTGAAPKSDRLTEGSKFTYVSG